jgi:hypothetical protein
MEMQEMAATSFLRVDESKASNMAPLGHVFMADESRSGGRRREANAIRLQILP